MRRRVTGEVLYRGDVVECPCCGHRFREFRADKEPNRVCWWCGSYERERAIFLILRRRDDLLHAGMRILHVAPEPPIVRLLGQVPGIEHIGGDLDGRFAERVIDVTALDFPDAHFDAVFCNHVLEHVPADRAAMRELRRVAKPGAWAFLLTPLRTTPTDEDPSVTDVDERIRRFGQHDHVRIYNRDDYLDRLRQAGWEPSISYFADIAPGRVERYGFLLGDDGVVLARAR